MEENRNDEEIKEYSKVPAKQNMWSSFKKVALYNITVELTPYQEKVFKEVSDFWNQEIYLDKGNLRLRPRDYMENDGLDVNVDL